MKKKIKKTKKNKTCGFGEKPAMCSWENPTSVVMYTSVTTLPPVPGELPSGDVTSGWPSQIIHYY